MRREINDKRGILGIGSGIKCFQVQLSLNNGRIIINRWRTIDILLGGLNPASMMKPVIEGYDRYQTLMLCG
jgi:hypothetical protein